MQNWSVMSGWQDLHYSKVSKNILSTVVTAPFKSLLVSHFLWSNLHTLRKENNPFPRPLKFMKSLNYLSDKGSKVSKTQQYIVNDLTFCHQVFILHRWYPSHVANVQYWSPHTSATGITFQVGYQNWFHNVNSQFLILKLFESWIAWTSTLSSLHRKMFLKWILGEFFRKKEHIFVSVLVQEFLC